MLEAEHRKKFIEAWGNLGSKWGISKTMAQIHAFLLIADGPTCACTLKDSLELSIGCVSMNVRKLLEWDLIYSTNIPGERREFYTAEKDMWKILTSIIKNRKEEELSPLQTLLQDFQGVESSDKKNDPTFFKTMDDIRLFADKADTILEHFIQQDNSLLFKGARYLFR